MIIKAIPTRYKGYHFRSMSEARWAVFMDYMGIEWGYEVQGFETPWGPYLPDFCARGECGDVWIEVKGPHPSLEEQFKLAHIVQAVGWKPVDLGFGPTSRFGLMVWGLSNRLSLAPCYPPYDSAEHGGLSEAYEDDEPFYDFCYGNPHPRIPELDKPYGGWLELLLGCGLVNRRVRASKVQKAVYTARSARFDRGQTPT